MSARGGDARAPRRGVFLDAGSVDGGDLDTGALRAALPRWDWFEHTPEDQRARRLEGAEVVVTNKCVLDAALLGGADALRLVAVAATGTNNVDLDAARAAGVTVCNCRDYATAAVAQHAVTLILNLLTGQADYVARVRAGEWTRAPHFSLFDREIREVAGLTLCIVGHGVLGRAVAERARALGMNVIVAERRGRSPRPGRVAFDEALRACDVLSLHCPLTPETEGLIDATALRAMKPGAFVVNTARGGIVDERDLAEALREGAIAGAGVDTLSVEPPPPDHPLLAPDIPNLLLTPHNAWASRRARQALLDQVAEVIGAFAAGAAINRVS